MIPASPLAAKGEPPSTLAVLVIVAILGGGYLFMLWPKIFP
jgi:hypothetical protein